MTNQDRDAARAQQIARDEQGSEANGYLSWENNHSCGGYGCCGGGKDIDRKELARAIQQALADVRAETVREIVADLTERAKCEATTVLPGLWFATGLLELRLKAPSTPAPREEQP